MTITNFCSQELDVFDRVVYIRVFNKRHYKCIGEVIGFTPKKVKIRCEYQENEFTKSYEGRIDTVFVDEVICKLEEYVHDFTGDLI